MPMQKDLRELHDIVHVHLRICTTYMGTRVNEFRISLFLLRDFAQKCEVMQNCTLIVRFLAIRDAVVNHYRTLGLPCSSYHKYMCMA